MPSCVIDESECAYLAAVDARIRQLRTRVARNPDPRDPEHDADAADQLAEIEMENAIARREFLMGAMTLNEFMVAVRRHLGSTAHSQIDAIRYELAKALVTQ